MNVGSHVSALKCNMQAKFGRTSVEHLPTTSLQLASLAHVRKPSTAPSSASPFILSAPTVQQIAMLTTPATLQAPLQPTQGKGTRRTGQRDTQAGAGLGRCYDLSEAHVLHNQHQRELGSLRPHQNSRRVFDLTCTCPGEGTQNPSSIQVQSAGQSPLQHPHVQAGFLSTLHFNPGAYRQAVYDDDNDYRGPVAPWESSLASYCSPVDIDDKQQDSVNAVSRISLPLHHSPYSLPIYQHSQDP